MQVNQSNVPLIGSPTFVWGLVSSSNPLVSTLASAFIVFAPLYILSSFGYNWPWMIAVLVGMLFLLRKVGEQGSTFG